MIDEPPVGDDKPLRTARVVTRLPAVEEQDLFAYVPLPLDGEGPGPREEDLDHDRSPVRSSRPDVRDRRHARGGKGVLLGVRSAARRPARRGLWICAGIVFFARGRFSDQVLWSGILVLMVAEIGSRGRRARELLRPDPPFVERRAKGPAPGRTGMRCVINTGQRDDAEFDALRGFRTEEWIVLRTALS